MEKEDEEEEEAVVGICNSKSDMKTARWERMEGPYICDLDNCFLSFFLSFCY